VAIEARGAKENVGEDFVNPVAVGIGHVLCISVEACWRPRFRPRLFDATHPADARPAGTASIKCERSRSGNSTDRALAAHEPRIKERIGNAGALLCSITENTETTSPTGRMTMRMVGAFAAFERA
jgi:hypothetical protein